MMIVGWRSILPLAPVLLCMLACTGCAERNACVPALQDLLLTMAWKNIQWQTATQDANNYVNLYSEPFNASSMIPTRMQIWRTQAFLTFPRYRPGVPFSLGLVSLTSQTKIDTELFAYPTWLEHDDKNGLNIVNAIDIFIDTTDTLWVLDTGQINTLACPRYIAPPRVFGIDVRDRRLLKVHDLSTLTCAKSRLQFIVAEVTSSNVTNLMISDAGTRSILVLQNALASDGRAFRIRLPPLVCLHTNCHPDLLHLLIARICSDPCTHTPEHAQLFFSYLGGEYMFTATAQHFSTGQTLSAVENIGVKPLKMMWLGTDGGSNLYFRNENDNVIYAWNVNTKFDSENFVEADRSRSCRQATSVTLGYKGLIWALESNIWDYLYGKVSSMGAGAWIRPLVKVW